MKVDIQFQFDTLDEFRQVFRGLLQDFEIRVTDQQAAAPAPELIHREMAVPSTVEEKNTDMQQWIDSQADSIRAETALPESKKQSKLYHFVGVQTIVCPGCKKPFIKKRKDQTFCSKTCHKGYREPHRIVVCPTCDMPFEQKNKNGVFCSKACRPSSKKPVDLTDNLCPECGNKFDKNPRIKFCSKKCTTKAKNRIYTAKQALKKEAAASIIQQNYGKTTMIADPAPVDQAQVAQSPVAPAPVADFAPLTPVVEKHYDLEQQKKKLDKIKKEIPIRRDRPEVEHYF